MLFLKKNKEYSEEKQSKLKQLEVRWKSNRRLGRGSGKAVLENRAKLNEVENEKNETWN